VFADPITITVNSVAQTLNRTSMGVNSGAFRTADGTHSLTISHQLGKSFNQRMIRLDRVQNVSDPFTTGEFLTAPDSVWLVSRTPGTLLSVASQKQLDDGFLSFLSASTGAMITKLLNGES